MALKNPNDSDLGKWRLTSEECSAEAVGYTENTQKGAKNHAKPSILRSHEASAITPVGFSRSKRKSSEVRPKSGRSQAEVRPKSGWHVRFFPKSRSQTEVRAKSDFGLFTLGRSHEGRNRRMYGDRRFIPKYPKFSRSSMGTTTNKPNTINYPHILVDGHEYDLSGLERHELLGLHVTISGHIDHIRSQLAAAKEEWKAGGAGGRGLGWRRAALDVISIKGRQIQLIQAELGRQRKGYRLLSDHFMQAARERLAPAVFEEIFYEAGRRRAEERKLEESSDNNALFHERRTT